MYSARTRPGRKEFQQIIHQRAELISAIAITRRQRARCSSGTRLNRGEHRVERELRIGYDRSRILREYSPPFNEVVKRFGAVPRRKRSTTVTVKFGRGEVLVEFEARLHPGK